MTQKVVYNNCFGGWGVDPKAVEWMRQQSKDEWGKAVEDAETATLPGETSSDGSGPKSELSDIGHWEMDRTNELLVAMLEGKVNYDGPIDSDHADLRVAEVPDGVSWEIDTHNGQETVKESARTFR